MRRWMKFAAESSMTGEDNETPALRRIGIGYNPHLKTSERFDTRHPDESRGPDSGAGNEWRKGATYQ
jgi:hypothetical protein